MTRKVDLVERLGGIDRMRVVLTDFYDRLFEDPLVGFFFMGRDKATLVERQLRFTARALGHPIDYDGKTIPDAHAPLPPILPGHFDRRHRLLEQTLVDHAIPSDVQKAWLQFDRSFRRAVLHR